MPAQKTTNKSGVLARANDFGKAVTLAAGLALLSSCAHAPKQESTVAVAKVEVSTKAASVPVTVMVAEVKRKYAERTMKPVCERPGSFCNKETILRNSRDPCHTAQWVTAGSKLATQDYAITVMGVTEYGVILLAESPKGNLMFQPLYGKDFLDAPEVGIVRVEKGNQPNTASVRIK